jgi:hypothetical protein
MLYEETSAYITGRLRPLKRLEVDVLAAAGAFDGEHLESW